MRTQQQDCPHDFILIVNNHAKKCLVCGKHCWSEEEELELWGLWNKEKGRGRGRETGEIASTVNQVF